MSAVSRLYAVVICLLLCGCEPSSKDAIQLAEKQVSEMLKDPESARFTGSYFLENPSAGDGYTSGHVCGVVNGKNSFGAYAGGKRYVATAFFGKGVLDVSNVQIESGSSASVTPGGPTPFESVYWNPGCVKGYVVPPAPTKRWGAQFAMLHQKSAADKVLKKLQSVGVSAKLESSGEIYNVVSGPYEDEEAVKKELAFVEGKLGIKGFIVSSD